VKAQDTQLTWDFASRDTLSSPSESDAKQAVQAELGDCKYVDMSDFDKVNGQQGYDENHYEVQIKYKLTLDADSGQKDKLKTHLDELNQRNGLIKQEEQIRVSFMNQGRGGDAYNDPTWKDLDQKQKALFQQLTTTYGPAAVCSVVSSGLPQLPRLSFQSAHEQNGWRCL
jgi:hypothetical protein